MFHPIKVRTLIISLLISLGTGFLSSMLSMGCMERGGITFSPLTPPGWVFFLVWTILYLLMGISAYLVYESKSPYKKRALWVYAASLVVNFFWSILFFCLRLYWASFYWILLLFALVLLTIFFYRKISPLAAYLQVPYLIWLIFAGYLNLAAAFLN